MLLEIIEPSLLQNWISVHYPTCLRASAGDSWSYFLSTHGGTGTGFHDLESSWLTASPQLSPGGTLADQWSNFVSAQAPAGGQLEDKVRTYFSS